MDQEDVDLLDYWFVIRKRLAGVAALVAASVMSALVISLVLPKIYEAKATVLAPKEQAAGGGHMLAAALAASGAGQLLGGILSPAATSRDIFVSILKSDTMARDVVEKFRLMDYYRTKFRSIAVKSLQGDTAISVSKEGAIAVSTQHADPKIVADMANSYVENLDRLFAKLGTTDASRQRAFVQERLEKTQADLRAAEEALRRFQESNKAIVLQEQAKAAIEAAAQLRGEIAAAEVQLQVMRTFATERNPDVVKLEKRLAEMKGQLGKMQFGSGLDLPDHQSPGGPARKEIFVPAVRVPQLALELVRLIRDVKVQETVFQLLTAQLEQAKIGEARDTPVVQVLDRAVVPDRKSKPRTVFNVVIAGVLSTFVGIFGAFFLEHLESARRRRGRYDIPEERASALRPGGGEGLPRSNAKPLAAPTFEEGTEEEDDVVDVGQLKFVALAPEGKSSAVDEPGAGGHSAHPRGAKK